MMEACLIILSGAKFRMTDSDVTMAAGRQTPRGASLTAQHLSAPHSRPSPAFPSTMPPSTSSRLTKPCQIQVLALHIP